MEDKIYNVLFICTGNSARSVLAEAIMNHLRAGKFKAFSAGSFPRGVIHPVAHLRSKSWGEFAGPDAPKMDLIFTVCDRAAGEVCPAWPGQPITAHWGFADPAQVEGDEETQYKAFIRTYMEIANRLRIFLSQPLDKIDRMSLQNELRKLGAQ